MIASELLEIVRETSTTAVLPCHSRVGWDMDNRSRYQFGEFVIDVLEGGLWLQGEPVPLTPKAFDVLAALVEQPGRLVSKDELLQKVWPDTLRRGVEPRLQRLCVALCARDRFRGR